LAYRIRQEYKNCSIFWIPASDIESLRQAYTHIAQRLNIPGWDNERADVKNLVQLHLSKESTGQWLLVFDNADEARLETVGSSQAVSLIECLPSSEQGAIVFTTNDRKTAVILASQNIVELPEIEQDIAQRMLKMCLINPANERGEVDLLVQELAYLPLAIVQAAAYINVNKITLKDYLSLLAEKKEEIVGRISEELDDEWQHRSIGNPIATTWLISFEQIRSRDVLATDFLIFMACIDRKDVPLALLPTAPPREEMDAVGTLDAYSLITKRTAESALDLHRLVHLAIRNWLQKQGLLSQRTQVAITRLLEVFPDDNHGNRSKWRRLLPHAKYALLFGRTGQESEARANLVQKCAMTLYSDGRFIEAEAYFHEAVQNLRRVLGEEHPYTLTSMANLALTYSNQGRWKEAEELKVRVMETSLRVLGKEHPYTLTSMANLASTYRNQGRWKEAEELEVRVIETSLRVLGEEHPDTLVSMGNLASTYRNQGRWKEAEELEVRVMETSLRVLGEDHPSTLTSMGNLASTYWNQGRWKEAEELEVRAMETKKKVLGEDHPDTLTSMGNLASTYRNQGRWKEAEELIVECLRLMKLTLGNSHPDTLVCSETVNKWTVK
jgi:tetratricopeptide (TPR) repeat protein